MSITKLNNLSVSALTALPSGLGGKVLQVVTATTTSATVTTSTSYVDVGVSLSITPSSASNKIFLVATSVNELNGASKTLDVRILRNSTEINSASYKEDSSGTGGKTTGAMNLLDSPATTSAITYKLQIKSLDGTIIVFNVNASSGNIAVLTAFEIAG
jgi:hypothetical protein